jgi:hypothetical protein
MLSHGTAQVECGDDYGVERARLNAAYGKHECGWGRDVRLYHVHNVVFGI